MSDANKVRSLYSYVSTYLKEEILVEQFVILEFIRLNEYYEKHFEFTYFRSKDNLEIDLIIKRPGLSEVLIEIKSKDYFDADDSKSLRSITKEFKKPELYVFSNCQTISLFEKVHHMPWNLGIKKILSPRNLITC